MPDKRGPMDIIGNISPIPQKNKQISKPISCFFLNSLRYFQNIKNFNLFKYVLFKDIL